MLSEEFLCELKRKTEENWRARSINPTIYGFQFQPGTGWNPGLSNEQILAYERAVGVTFPFDLKALFRVMNGTDLPTLNIYGGSGYPKRESVGVYVYPRDLEVVRKLILDANENRGTLRATLTNEGFDLVPTSKLMPIYAHRYVVCDGAESSAVLSIWDAKDAIVYGNSLQEYLEREFLGIEWRPA
jgi:hypothetical protein